MRQILDTVDRIERALIAVLSGTALCLACLAMAGRYLFKGLALDWTFEVTIFALIWAVFLAGARTAGRGEHVQVDSLLRLMPRPVQTGLDFFAGAIGIGVAVFLAYSGTAVVQDALRWGETTTSTLRLPLWVYYLSLPVGGVMLAFHLAVRSVRLAAGRGAADPDRPHG